ncbi:MAG: diguanylate cyclase [Acidobacteria bacterium]|nr:diguanylate cyclase [Acidobacteriota bacterium]
MSEKRQVPPKSSLERTAKRHGIAVVVVDEAGKQGPAVNDNSICAVLNPNGVLVGRCARDCGRALERATDGNATISYTCHAGLLCRAARFEIDGKPAAVIVGRAFTSSENYRRAANRAMTGDWRDLPASRFFENILILGSDAPIVDALREIKDEAKKQALSPAADSSEAKEIARRAAALNAKKKGTSSGPDPAAWRSFFGSLLGRDYISARNATIEFVARQFEVSSLIWLEERGDRLESTAVSAKLKGRSINVGIDLDDERLAEAAAGEKPVVLGRSPTPEEPDPKRILLFAMPVGDDIPAALVVLDKVPEDARRRAIARFCRAVAPQLEILRLRAEMERRAHLDEVSERLAEGIRELDTRELWRHLARVSADLLQSERASLMTREGSSENFRVKGSVGSLFDLENETAAGERVARIVFERGRPIVVRDAAATGLPPVDKERKYKTASFLSAPIWLGERQLAVINFTDKVTGTPFDGRDLDLVKAIAPQLAAVIDRTQLVERAGELEQLSVTDPLTGLLNRRYMVQRLSEEVKRSNRHGYPMAFVMLDVDHFKSYNDNFGHPAGDEALKIVASVIRETLRDADVAVRFGGEEFAILLPQTTDAEAANIANRVRQNVASTEFPHRKVTVSVGVASCSSEVCAKMDMISAADKALYQAKAEGRDRVVIYQPTEDDLPQE